MSALDFYRILRERGGNASACQCSGKFADDRPKIISDSQSPALSAVSDSFADYSELELLDACFGLQINRVKVAV